jgi:hypothetical protein
MRGRGWKSSSHRLENTSQIIQRASWKSAVAGDTCTAAKADGDWTLSDVITAAGHDPPKEQCT